MVYSWLIVVPPAVDGLFIANCCHFILCNSSWTWLQAVVSCLWPSNCCCCTGCWSGSTTCTRTPLFTSSWGTFTSGETHFKGSTSCGWVRIKSCYIYQFAIFHDHALMLHYENKTNKHKWKYVNLLHYERCKPPTCFGHLDIFVIYPP